MSFWGGSFNYFPFLKKKEDREGREDEISDMIHDLSYLLSYITKALVAMLAEEIESCWEIACDLNKRPPLYIVFVQHDLSYKSLCKTQMVKDVNALSPLSGLSFQGCV